MGDIRDKVDLAAVAGNMKRAAQAGGPRQIAKYPGGPKGADRFPAKRRGRKTSRR